MATVTVERQDFSQQQLYTCLSCSIAFTTPEDQRVHYRSDHHRYNMKRRVASLPPVSLTTFNQKVLDRRAETAIMASAKGSVCEVCNKTYTTENAYRTHIGSKKHKENELRATTKAAVTVGPSEEQPPTSSVLHQLDASAEQIPKQAPQETPLDLSSSNEQFPKKASQEAPVASSSTQPVPDADEDGDIEMSIEQKIAAARSRLSPADCLFCSHAAGTLEENAAHMLSVHSFFIPDMEYLVDLKGLITYLGEKVAVGNVCLYCNMKGKEFRTLDAVRKHMVDKSHCKLAYDTEADRLEVSEYFDFSSSYPDFETHKKRKVKGKSTSKPKEQPVKEGDQEWEDVSDDGEADEVIEEEGSTPPDSEQEDDSDDDVPDSQLKFGDSPFELVLASGARIGHRSMQRYYAQSLPRSRGVPVNSKVARFREIVAQSKDSALVPRKGGFGAYGQGTEVVKARNRGEAREAGRHIREFRDQQRREQYKTRVGFVHNHQKHFRDPLLQ